MSGLLDIAVVKEQVMVGAVAVEIQGISVGDIAALMNRFPALKQLLSGGEVDVPSLLAMGDKIIGAIIAAGCGMSGHEAAEMKARSLPIGAQADLLSAILKVTMPGGISPLVEKISSLGSAFNISAADLPADLAAASRANSHQPSSH